VTSQHLAPPRQMTACPSGCNLPGQDYRNSKTFSVSNVQSTFFPQTKVTGTVVATNSSGSKSWTASGYAFCGHGYCCEPQDVFVGPNSSVSFPCAVDITKPSSLPAGTIAGSVSGTQVSYNNPQPLDGNAYWQVTAQDCANGFAATQQQGTTWGTQWVNAQVPPNWQLAHQPPDFSWSNVQCPEGARIEFFNASSVTTVSDAAFSPADAQSLALARLNSQVPAGYTLQSNSVTVCTPKVSGLTDGTISLSCSDTGRAIRTWTDGMKAQLAANVAGKSKGAAQTICNGTSGVQAGSCVITLPAGDTSLPTDASQIKIQANEP
jgi:hypothetical protein